jgi:hypothetical protein
MLLFWLPQKPAIVLRKSGEFLFGQQFLCVDSLAVAVFLDGHKRGNYMLDNDFSPAYTYCVKLDRLQTKPPIIC